jgi:hypothetical protein
VPVRFNQRIECAHQAPCGAVDVRRKARVNVLPKKVRSTIN